MSRVLSWDRVVSSFVYLYVDSYMDMLCNCSGPSSKALPTVWTCNYFAWCLINERANG